MGLPWRDPTPKGCNPAVTVSQFDPPWVLPPMCYNEVELRLD
ncbi:MAG: hypothetical protein VX899_14665 [Myxococcota bacterium]|nr:hypothetical protein [Myxococcota bacterium]